MDGRKLVSLIGAKSLGRMLETVRGNGVSRFRLGPDGSMEVEFYPAEAVYNAPPPITKEHGEGAPESAPPTGGIATLPATDPLFDGLADTP